MRIVIEIVAIRCQILRQKCTKFDFFLGRQGGKRKGGKDRGKQRRK